METKTLLEFGLTPNESQIFITISNKGTVSATEVSKLTGLNRPYIYYALERLLEKGYLTEIHDRGKKVFKAVSFSHILSSEEQKIELLKEFFKEVETKKVISQETSVEVIKGRFTVKNIIKMHLAEVKQKEEILYLGLDEEKMEKIEPIYLKKVLNVFKEKKITERIIIRKGGKRLPYAVTSQYRYLDPNLLGNTAKMIFQNTVVELIFSDPLYAIIIKNKEVADTARKQFEVFWKIARRL